ncbi:ABC transporter permease [Zavarzinia sp. CC-PAN008]|uniref:ABC transporter permease n=1 Tax=Zavarzinia sp. CC-PAN008 TaxID=3243332 RepID=UPI003F74A0F9
MAVLDQPAPRGALAQGETTSARRWRLGDPWVWLAAPAVIMLVFVFVAPLLALATNSLHPGASMGRIKPDWTLDNYVRFLSDPYYLGILLDTFVVGLLVVAVSATLSYPVAYYLARTRSRWRAVFSFVVVAPLLISVVVRNLGWIPVLGDSGLINWLLLSSGLTEKPVKLVYNEFGVVLGLVHSLSPLMILSLANVIRRIEPEIEEASINLGATPFETFWRVILPLSRPGLLAGGLLVFTLSISAYITPAMMGGKKVLVMALLIEQQIRSVLNYPFGATVAVVLLVVTAGLTVLALRVGRERELRA